MNGQIGSVGSSTAGLETDLPVTPPEAQTVLLVDDDFNFTAGLKRALRGEPYSLETAPDAAVAQRVLSSKSVDLVVSDECMPGLAGTKFLAQIKEDYPEIIRIMLTGTANADVAIRAINDGEVFRFFVKPCNTYELAATIRDALKQKSLMDATRQLLATVRAQGAIIAELEQKTPGITNIERDVTGAIVADETPLDLDTLLKEVTDELDAAERRRTA